MNQTNILLGYNQQKSICVNWFDFTCMQCIIIDFVHWPRISCYKVNRSKLGKTQADEKINKVCPLWSEIIHLNSTVAFLALTSPHLSLLSIRLKAPTPLSQMNVHVFVIGKQRFIAYFQVCLLYSYKLIEYWRIWSNNN